MNKDEPQPSDPIQITTSPRTPVNNSASFGMRISRIFERTTTRDGWFGDYDYAWYVPPL